MVGVALDELALVGVHTQRIDSAKAEHIAKEQTIAIGVLAIEKNMGPNDHMAILPRGGLQVLAMTEL